MTTFKTFGRLPGRPSELLRLALADLDAAKKSGVEINMDDWVGRGQKKKCAVCLAGAVMISRLDVPRDGRHSSPLEAHVNAEWRALQALNSLRSGWLEDAASWLGVQSEEIPPDRYITSYAYDPKGWHRDMKQLLADLEAASL